MIFCASISVARIIPWIANDHAGRTAAIVASCQSRPFVTFSLQQAVTLSCTAEISPIQTFSFHVIYNTAGDKLRNISRSIVLAILISGPNAFAAEPTKELSWSSVQLEGARLQLVSPKDKDRSQELYFVKGGNLIISSCIKDTCTGPVTIWKIENNRLKTGFAPSEGDALIKLDATRLTLRKASGKIVVYEIKIDSKP